MYLKDSIILLTNSINYMLDDQHFLASITASFIWKLRFPLLENQGGKRSSPSIFGTFLVLLGLGVFRVGLLAAV